MVGVCFIGQQQFCRSDGSRSGVFAIVAGIIPAAGYIHLIALLIELIGKIHLSRAVLRMSHLNLQTGNVLIVKGSPAAGQRKGTPGLYCRNSIDIITDGKIVGFTAADF